MYRRANSSGQGTQPLQHRASARRYSAGPIVSAMVPTPAIVPSSASPGVDRPDAFRRAGVDQIARVQVIERREVRDDLGHLVNQLRDVRRAA